MATVSGRWGYPDQSIGPTKAYHLLFTVEKVDDVPLQFPLVLPIDNVNVKTRDGRNAVLPSSRHRELDQVSWTIRGYETGRYTVIPAEYWGTALKGGAITPQDAFVSELVGTLAN